MSSLIVGGAIGTRLVKSNDFADLTVVLVNLIGKLLIHLCIDLTIVSLQTRLLNGITIVSRIEVVESGGLNL